MEDLSDRHIMKLLLQLLLLFVICQIGKGCAALLPFSFPSSIVSMILLFLLLLVGIIKEAQIEKGCDFLLKHMALFFVPSGVAIMNEYSLLKGKILILLFICVFTTVITFTVTAYTVQVVLNWQKRRR
ncbi:MAG: CidA/LrgA family protein [Candidatus Fimousia sp.]